MNLNTLLQTDSIFLSLDANTKETCLVQMANSLVKSGCVVDQATYLKAVNEREEHGSTGIGFGIAIPHGKSAGVKQAGIAFAKLKAPIEWKSLDAKPVQIVFMLAIPESAAGNDHLKILVAISRKLMHEEFRQQLFNAKSADDVRSLLETV